MSQPPSGLRFDIYERVHLPENTAGIRELNGIELTPEITVIAQGEQAVLKGHLALTGTYAGDDEARAEEEELSHRIPVEITLPLSRVESVDNIRVEIENFDVDVLSSRSLNVTGVLSLEGIEMATAAETEWREEEEVVFTHRVEEPGPAAVVPTPAPVAPPSPPPSPIAALSAETPPPSIVEPNPPQPIEAVEPAANEAAAIAAEPEPNAMPAEAAENAAAPNAPAEELAEAMAEETKPPEKQEIKIAFSGKAAEAAADAPIGVDSILTMANAGAAAQAPAEKRPEETAEEAAVSPESAEGKDKLEWKKLFLHAANDQPSFRKVRMCIAQKEDTLETIADRYKKNPRELALYNRLTAEYLQEGQVVYIP